MRTKMSMLIGISALIMGTSGMIATPASAATSVNCVQVFSLIDTNGNGFIATQELATALRRYGLHPTEAQLQAIIYSVDIDGDGQINYEEFQKGLATLQIQCTL